MSESKYPPGWDEERVRRVLQHYEAHTGMRVIFTTHAHRRDGCDMGVFGTSKPPIAQGMALVDGEKGVEICDELKPLLNEIVIKKHRYSGVLRDRPRHRAAQQRHGDRDHHRGHDRELLPRHGPRRAVSQLRGHLPVGRHGDDRLP